MPPIPEGAALVAHRYAVPGDTEDMLITYGVVLEGAGDGQDVVNDLDTNWKTTLDDLTDPDTTLLGTTMYVGPSPPGAEVFESTNSAAVGTVAGKTAPPNVAMLVTKLTSLAGRRMRGRMFIPAVPDAAIAENGTLGGGTIAAWQPKVDDFYDGVNAIVGVAMVLLHGPATEWVLVGGQPRRVPVVGAFPGPTLVSALRLENKVATQRRRLRP